MKKKLCCLLLPVLALLLLSACGAPLDRELAADAEERAQQVVLLASNRNYQAITDMARADLKEVLSPEALATALDPMLDVVGEISEIGKFASTGTKDKDTGEIYAVVAVVGRYAEDKLTFTITFDQELALVGLYVR